MGYEYVKVVCLFCGATVEGDRQYMLGGKTFLGNKRLRENPEHGWAWNGLHNAIFYLCPNHQSKEDYEKAFDWADKHSKEMPDE